MPLRENILAAIALLLCACGGDDSETKDPTKPSPLPEDDPVVRPASTQELTFIETSFTMPAEWDGSAFSIAIHSDGRVMAGGPGGLFLITGQDVTLIDAEPVFGVVAHPDLDFVIARADGIMIYSDEMFFDAALNEALMGVSVLGLTQRIDTLWFTTDGELLELTDGMLSGYPDLNDVVTLATHDDTPYLIVDDSAGAVTLLRQTADALEAQPLSEELEGMSGAAPGPQERVFALAGGDSRMFERVPVEGGVLWKPLALTTDEADPGASGIGRMVADPVSGSLWLEQSMALLRVDGAGENYTVSAVPWPSAIGAAGAMVATPDGGLWMSDDGTLVRVAPESPPPSYETDVMPWYEANCSVCHEEGGQVATATRFGGFDEFAGLIETIIEQVESGLMPGGDNVLLGDPELPRKWRDGGMRP